MKSNNKSELLNSDLTNFLLNIGHELRTPLNTVFGYTQLLNNVENISPLAKEYVSTIIENELTVVNLINDIFELLKYNNGSTMLNCSEVNPKKLINDLISTFKDLFKNKLIYLKVNYLTEIPSLIKTDPTKLTHILSNLIANGLKFTRKGGVTIHVSYTDHLIIDIEDTGIGMEESEISSLFPPIDKSMQSLSTISGNGLGLFIARVFAQMLEGDITLVQTTLDLGTTFRLEIKAPVITENSSKKITVTDYTTIKGLSKPCKVLLVDDVDINLAMLEIFLTPVGFDVCIATDGNEAIAKCESFNPDIIFMDLIMPRKDGFQATKEIKSKNEDIPIIALTASLSDIIKVSALQAGVNDFMTKPFVPERFFEIIANYTSIEYIF